MIKVESLAKVRLFLCPILEPLTDGDLRSRSLRARRA